MTHVTLGLRQRSSSAEDELETISDNSEQHQQLQVGG